MKRILIIPNDNQINFHNDDGEVDIGRTDLSLLMKRWIHAIQYDAVNDTYEVHYVQPGMQKYTGAEGKARFPELAAMIASGKESADAERARLNARKALYDATVSATQRAEDERIEAQRQQAELDKAQALQLQIDQGLVTPEGGPVPGGQEPAAHVHGPGGHTHG